MKYNIDDEGIVNAMRILLTEEQFIEVVEMYHSRWVPGRIPVKYYDISDITTLRTAVKGVNRDKQRSYQALCSMLVGTDIPPQELLEFIPAQGNISVISTDAQRSPMTKTYIDGDEVIMGSIFSKMKDLDTIEDVEKAIEYADWLTGKGLDLEGPGLLAHEHVENMVLTGVIVTVIASSAIKQKMCKYLLRT